MGLKYTQNFRNKTKNKTNSRTTFSSYRNKNRNRKSNTQKGRRMKGGFGGFFNKFNAQMQNAKNQAQKDAATHEAYLQKLKNEQANKPTTKPLTPDQQSAKARLDAALKSYNEVKAQYDGRKANADYISRQAYQEKTSAENILKMSPNSPSAKERLQNAIKAIERLPSDLAYHENEVTTRFHTKTTELADARKDAKKYGISGFRDSAGFRESFESHGNSGAASLRNISITPRQVREAFSI